MNPTIERLLWDHEEVQTVAKLLGIENPERPLEGRGQVRPVRKKKSTE